MLRRLIPLVTVAVLSALTTAQKIAVTGIPVAANAPLPIRKNINDLQKEGGAAWDLYIRALTSLQAAKHTDVLSYFQLAGIHGKPYIEYNGGGAKNSNDWLGYCPHGEKLFMPWHRPYVVLYEQTLVNEAKRLAKTYPSKDQARYIAAAETLRVPFWDWSSDSRVPGATVPTTITVNFPNGQALESRQIQNPLQTFRFPNQVMAGQYGPWDSQNRQYMLRCPAPDSYPNSANGLMAQRPYKRWTYDAFSSAKDFSDFASTGTSGVSVEQIHNGVHWDAACAGQFLAAETSAFDPIFWLHHAQVDRLWAYWQAMKPKDGRFYNPYTGGARYSTPQNSQITPDSPLNPFFQANGQFHTTKSVEKVQNFGYTYQNLDWNKPAAQLAADATALINRLYGPTTAAMVKRATTQTKYFVRASIDVTEVVRPCAVTLYVDGQRVGQMVVMQQPSQGVIHNAFSLDEDVEYTTMGAAQGVKSIKKTLTVDITKVDGTQIPLDTVPSLKIEIENVLVTPPTSITELPTYSNSTVQPAPKVENTDPTAPMF